MTAPYRIAMAAARNATASWHPILVATLLFTGCMLVDAQFAAHAGAQPAEAPQASTRSAGAAQDRRRFNEAVHLYRSGRWSAAYGRFMVLADRGHARAARIALSMQRDGPSRYDSLWDATPAQLEAWERAAGAERAPLFVLNP
jgi:hypothetical protein